MYNHVFKKLILVAGFTLAMSSSLAEEGEIANTTPVCDDIFNDTNQTITHIIWAQKNRFTDSIIQFDNFIKEVQTASCNKNIRKADVITTLQTIFDCKIKRGSNQPQSDDQYVLFPIIQHPNQTIVHEQLGFIRKFIQDKISFDCPPPIYKYQLEKSLDLNDILFGFLHWIKVWIPNKDDRENIQNAIKFIFAKDYGRKITRIYKDKYDKNKNVEYLPWGYKKVCWKA